jgi:hypothetical protein
MLAARLKDSSLPCDDQLGAACERWRRMTVHTEREIPLSPGSDGMLAHVIHRVVEGRAEPVEVTAVLRRICAECRHRPPELLLIRIKELWTQVAGAPKLARDEKDRRYYAFLGEALVLYFGCSPADFVARRAVPLHGDGCGESESVALR